MLKTQFAILFVHWIMNIVLYKSIVWEYCIVVLYWSTRVLYFLFGKLSCVYCLYSKTDLTEIKFSFYVFDWGLFILPLLLFKLWIFLNWESSSDEKWNIFDFWIQLFWFLSLWRICHVLDENPNQLNNISIFKICTVKQQAFIYIYLIFLIKHMY